MVFIIPKANATFVPKFYLSLMFLVRDSWNNKLRP